MLKRQLLILLAGVFAAWVWSGPAGQAQYYPYYPAAVVPVYKPLDKFYYYPYYYFPHSYWPKHGPKWPEEPGKPYMRPPAYMSHPAFKEPHWRYEHWEPQLYYRGFHFWLDQF